MRYVDPSGHFIKEIGNWFKDRAKDVKECLKDVKKEIKAEVSSLKKDISDYRNRFKKYDVPLYDQGKHNLCWAYSQVMVECFHNGEEFSQKKADERAEEIARSESLRKYGYEDAWDRGGNPTNVDYSKVIYPRDINGIQGLQNLLIEADGPIYASYWMVKLVKIIKVI